MAGRPAADKARARGNIGTLRSGALRVRVYAGVDPVTKKRHDLVEVVPPGPNARRQAEKILDRFLHEIAEKRNPRTSATVDQLLTRYLDQFDGRPQHPDQLPRLHAQPRLPADREREGRCPRRRGAGLVLCRAPPLPAALLRQARHPALDAPGARMRPALHPPPRLPPTRRLRRAPHPLPALRRVRAGRPLAVGRREPGQPRHSPGRTQAEPAAAVPARGGSDRRGVVEGPGLGRARLDGDDDGRPPRRAMRDPPALGRPGRGPRDVVAVPRDP